MLPGVDLELRAVTPEELDAFSRAVGAAFGEQYSDQDVADWRPVAAGNSNFAVFDEGEVVATGGAFPFELTVPGGAPVRASGLTAVGVRPTHRRRGLLDVLMEHHLDEVAAAGWPLSVLTASESAIYGRYGYGSAAELAWRLADPRRAQTTRLSDHLWVRVLDVAASLGARRYPVADSLVLELSDPFRPANDGRWRLDAGPDRGTCARTGEQADVALGIADLGAAYLGGVRPSTLARAGRVEERSPWALARLDLLLGATPGPWCATDF
jgi:predicted acetyltransferase